jgi:hypothetical protein
MVSDDWSPLEGLALASRQTSRQQKAGRSIGHRLKAPIMNQTNCVEGIFLCFRHANNERRAATDHYHYAV